MNRGAMAMLAMATAIGGAGLAVGSVPAAVAPATPRASVPRAMGGEYRRGGWLTHGQNPKRRPVADIEQGFISTTSCILANLSMGLGGRMLQYDPAAGIVKGDAEATKLLARPYRKPWIHPDPKKV